jgi:hypothetical protein
MSVLDKPRSQWVHERHWFADTLPRRLILPPSASPSRSTAFDFTTHIRRVCVDAIAHCPEFAHIDPSAVLFTAIPARNRSRYGLQARVTPMRFRDGATVRRFRRTDYRVQRYFVDGRELLYLVSFSLPRFLDLPFVEKLVTVFHELYHIGPRFDGDLRRHAGRCEVHTGSKQAYDAEMAKLVRRYLAGRPDADGIEFLHLRAADLRRDYAGVAGIVVPRPKMIPIDDD